MSPVLQFRNPQFLIDSVKSALATHRLPAHRLTLEITESLFIEEVEGTLQTIEEIRALGVRFSLDDFGSGYSSLSLLGRLPLSIVKVDRSAHLRRRRQRQRPCNRGSGLRAREAHRADRGCRGDRDARARNCDEVDRSRPRARMAFRQAEARLSDHNEGSKIFGGMKYCDAAPPC